MAILSMDDLVAGITSGDRITAQKQGVSGTAGFFHSLWKAAGQPSAGATPASGAGAAPTRATAGAIPGWTDPGGGDEAYLAQGSLTSDDQGVYTLYDRLVHTGGLNGTLTSAQTINSAALTRYTDGVGVEAFLEVYTALGITSRTATISYTNQAGTAGRTGTCLTGTSAPQGRMVPFALEAGDTGVRSVESLTLSGSTGTAGEFGITLLKRIADFPSSAAPAYAPRDAFDLGLPAVKADACLALMTFISATAVGPVAAIFTIAKG